MRIVFMGTPSFAVASLETLFQNGFEISAVITAPDKPAGRGRKVQQSAVKEFALIHDIPVLQPVNLKDPEFIESLAALKPDLQVVVAFRMLPLQVFSLPPLGTFNLHGSLLPQYRGAAPINWAILNGETETGVTSFFLNSEIDKGAILMSEKISIGPDETAGELHDRLMELGAAVVLKTARMIEAGKAEPVVQPVSEDLKPAPKLFKADGEIEWNRSVKNIYNKIRGLSPYPAAYTSLQGLQLKIFEARPLSIAEGEALIAGVTRISLAGTIEENAAGSIVAGTIGQTKSKEDLAAGSFQTDGKTYLLYRANDGYLFVTDLQLENKKRMKTADFLRGYSFSTSAE